MEKRTRWIIILLLVAQLLMLAVAPAVAGGDAPAGAYEPESVTLDSETVHEIAVLGEQMQGYLALNKDGALSLGEIDTVGLDVSDQYLENYKAGLEYINAAIRQGLFTVDDNFQVSWPEDAGATANIVVPDATAPDWSSVPTSYGLYVNFSYRDVRYYLPRYGLSTALSLAAYAGRPWIVTPYTYHFTYYRVYGYYYQYAYQCCGVWSYVPWSYLGYYYGYYYPTYHYGHYWYYYWCYW